MSFEKEGLPETWEEIKEASRKLDWEVVDEEEAEKLVTRRYLTEAEREDEKQGYNPIPGYN